MEMNPIQSAVYAAIRKFVQRQSLVLEAMKDLRPDIVMRRRNEGDPDPKEVARLTQEYFRRPPVGDWGENKEWEFYLHGAGCRLTHKITNEPIEWDVGSLDRFDRFWFVYHLEWRLDSDVADEDISVIRAWLKKRLETWSETKPLYGPLQDDIFSVLEELRDLGILSRHEQYYTLIVEEESS